MSRWERYLTWRQSNFERNAAKFQRHRWRGAVVSGLGVAALVFLGQWRYGHWRAGIAALTFGLAWVVAFRFIVGPWWIRRTTRRSR